MISYIGTKIVNAEECSKHHFESYHRSNVSFLHNDQPGYIVIYEDGYKSWSPKEVFERCYRPITKSEINLIEKL
jgi:hypothetical protein